MSKKINPLSYYEMADLSLQEKLVHLRQSLKFWVNYSKQMEKANAELSKKVFDLENKLQEKSNA
jgi:hypothetical protein